MILRRALLFVACVACSSSGATGDGGADADCSPAAFACNVAATASLGAWDPAQRCVRDPAPVDGVCESTISPCYAAASIGSICAFAPDGGVFVATLRGDEDLSGAGWRFTRHHNDGPQLPADEQATTDEENECLAIMCAPMCADGGSAPVSPPECALLDAATE